MRRACVFALFALLAAACARTAPPDPPQATSASATPTTSAPASDDGCKHDDDCPIVMGLHQPCCLERAGHGRCSGLPPKADACPDLHRCVSDADCRGGATCTGTPSTCKGGSRGTGPVIPGECINAAPGTKLPDYCSHPR